MDTLEKHQKKKKRKLKLKGLLIIVLFLYLIGSILYCILKIPIKTVEVNGNYYLKDNYIKEYLNINDLPIIKIKRKDIENKLSELDLVKSAKIKKIYPFKIVIEIEEEQALFYNNNIKKVVLSSGREVEYNKEYLGIPTLINFTPEDTLKEFIKRLKKIDKENIALISEIEYAQLKLNGKIVDDQRFLFRMNDGNLVYINTINIEKFNDYLSIYEGIANKNGNQKGCLYLDSNSENINFDDCSGLQGSEGEDNE